MNDHEASLAEHLRGRVARLAQDAEQERDDVGRFTGPGAATEHHVEGEHHHMAYQEKGDEAHREARNAHRAAAKAHERNDAGREELTRKAVESSKRTSDPRKEYAYSDETEKAVRDAHK